jgi:hypothetical protein
MPSTRREERRYRQVVSSFKMTEGSGERSAAKAER